MNGFFQGDKYDRITYRYGFVVLLLLLHPNGFGQILGLEPPSTKWSKIHTPFADVIFEPGAELRAQRTANMIQYISGLDSSSIGGPAQHVPIILHGQSTLPAGVPFLAPWRSDWTITAPEDPFMGTVLWIDLLSIHEYRHHQQMMRGKRGWFSETLRGLMGQTGWFINILTIQPTWFFEGDATYAETVLTSGGRGRMPQFDREYRALRLSGLHYNYEKASRRSRKDFVPNVYRLGYYMTTYARKHFGNDTWTMVLEDTYQKKGLFYPFNRSLRKYTGLRTKDLYRATMKELDSMWAAEDESLEVAESRKVDVKTKKVYTDYRFPHYTKDGNIIVEKSSFQQIRTYYMLDGKGHETRILQPGNITPDHVNLILANDYIAWAENTYHPRWYLKDYSVLYTYNIKTKKKRIVTRKSRYYAPAPSYDGTKLAVIKVCKDGTQALDILDINSGSIIKVLEHAENGQFAYPRFTPDNKYVLVGFTNPQGNTIRKYEVASGTSTDLIPYSREVSKRPFEYDEYVIYSASNTGINNIFAVHQTSGEIFQVTSSRFGAHHPVVSDDGTTLLYTEYTALGFEVHETNMEPDKWVKFNAKIPSTIDFYKPLDQIEGGDITTKVEEVVYPTSRFRPTMQGLFKFHSWTPFVSQDALGFELISSNVMSNTSASIGLRYDWTHDIITTLGKVRYGALYPIFDLGYSFNIRGSERIYDTDFNYTEYNWSEHQLFGGINVPFKLTRGTYLSHLNLLTTITNHSIVVDPFEILPFDPTFLSANLGIEFSRTKQPARQQIKPPWGQSLLVSYNETNHQNEPGEMLYSAGSLYFPGFNRKHSIFFLGQLQYENLQSYRFERQFVPARGYNERFFLDKSMTDFEKVYMLSSNYEFPVMFPDWSFGSLAFVRTFSANLFYDYSIGEKNVNTTPMRSAGVDLNFDMTTFRLFLTDLTFRFLHRFDLPDPGMKSFYFNVVVNIRDLAF